MTFDSKFSIFGWWRSPFYLLQGLHFSTHQFARVSRHVADFNARNKSLTAKLLQQGYQYHKLRKTFSKFYRRHYELVSKFNVGLKTLLHQGLSEPEFYGDLFCYERGFMKSLSPENQADIIVKRLSIPLQYTLMIY